MSRIDQVYNASLCGIGYIQGCEDAAKKRVLRFFKKNNDINYKKLDQEYIDNNNLQYKKDQDRYNFLVNKMFNTVLNDQELHELHRLEDKIGSYTSTHYITKIILHSKIVMNILHHIPKKVKLKKVKIHVITALKKFYDTFIKCTFKHAYFGIYPTLNTIYTYIKSGNFEVFCDISPPRIWSKVYSKHRGVKSHSSLWGLTFYKNKFR